MNSRDVLAQIAICAALVISSLVAPRCLARPLWGHFGIQLRNSVLADVDPGTAGHTLANAPAAQKRMLDAMQDDRTVASAALVDWAPYTFGDWNTATVFSGVAEDLRPANPATRPYVPKPSAGHFCAAARVFVAGSDFTWHDDSAAPREAVVSLGFARRLFGGVEKALKG